MNKYYDGTLGMAQIIEDHVRERVEAVRKVADQRRSENWRDATVNTSDLMLIVGLAELCLRFLDEEDTLA